MAEKVEVKVERRFVGREPYEYEDLRDYTVLEGDPGFGSAGAKLDPRTGALMYDKYADIESRRTILKPDIKPKIEPKLEPKPEPKIEAPVRPIGVSFSDDSMAMIHIKETEEISLGADNKLKSHSASGLVSVKNLSSADRLWDVFVKLQDETGIAILDFDSVHATELEPNHKVSKNYKIDKLKPSIYLNEMISTHPDLPESVIIQKNQTSPVIFTLELHNLSSIPYENVVLRKEITEHLKNLVFPEESDKNTKLDEGVLTWKISEILPGDTKVLRFGCELTVESSEKIQTGSVEVVAKGKDTITNFVITDFDAMCRNMYFVEADETDEPEKWSCNFVCGNTSSFDVEIIKAEVRDSLTNNVCLNLFEPGINVPPNKRWESKHWIMDGRDRPTFITTVILNVLPGLTKDMNFRLTKESSAFKVASLAFTKSFNKDTVVAGRITELKAQIEIENMGSAAFEHIFVRDLIPTFMTPPTSYLVEHRGSRLTDNVNVFIRPEDEGIRINQQLSFQITDLSRHGGSLAPGEKILITYTTRLVKPVPNSVIDALAEVDGKPFLPGPIIPADVKGDLPSLKTVQILRKFSVGKSIEQGANIGEYNIGILYKNRGNQAIRNLIIQDILPKNFLGIEYTVEPEQVSTPGSESLLIWKIPVLHEGETTTILYKIKGEGEFHPTDAQIFYNTAGKLPKMASKDDLIKGDVASASPPSLPKTKADKEEGETPNVDAKPVEKTEPKE